MNEPLFKMEAIPIVGLRDTDIVIVRRQADCIIITGVTDKKEVTIALTANRLSEFIKSLQGLS